MSALVRGAWTPEEEGYLLEAWARGDSSGQIARKLNRLQKNVRAKICRMRDEKGYDLAKRMQKNHSSEELARIAEMWSEGKSAREIGAKTGHTWEIVTRIVTRLRQKDPSLERRREDRRKRFASVATIKAVVAQHYDIPADEIAGQCRKAKFNKPRQLAMALCYELSGLTLPALTKFFNRADHTTILHGARAAKAKWPDELAELRAAVLAAPSEVAPEAVEETPASLPAVPRFEPRRCRPARIITITPRRRDVTGALMGDPGHINLRIARGERSKCDM